MSLISAWTLFLAVLLSHDVITTPAPWQDKSSGYGNSERIPVEAALQHLAGIIHYLKTLGLSNDMIKNAVDDNFERQDQGSFSYESDRNWAPPSPSTATRHQAEDRQKFFKDVISSARFHFAPESFVVSRIHGSPYGSGPGLRRPAAVASGLSPIDVRYLATSNRHQVNQRGPGKAFSEGARPLMNSNENRLAGPVLRAFLNYPINTRNFRNRNRQEKVSASRTKPENADGSLSGNSNNGRGKEAISEFVSTLKQVAPNKTPRQGLNHDRFGLAKISKTMKNPLSPIKGVALEISLPGDVTHRLTVALSPGLSIYRALYQAALHYDGDDVTKNPFEVSIEPDVEQKCYVISGVSGLNNGVVDHWLITVMDANGEVKYEGHCLMPNSKLPLRPGYQIHIQHEPHKK